VVNEVLKLVNETTQFCFTKILLSIVQRIFILSYKYGEK